MPEIAGIGILSAFLAGLVSFLSPCVLPLVPGYVSYVAGRSLDELRQPQALRRRVAILGLSSSFVLGFSAVFVSFGASASAAGGLLQAYRFEAGYVAGAIIILFGLHVTGLVRFGWMNRDLRLLPSMPGGRPLGAFFLGSAFAFGWTPCIGPVLGAILTLGASTMAVSEGAALLSVYSLGLAVPFLVVAAFTGAFMEHAHRLRLVGPHLQTVAGGIMVLVGVLLMTGYLSSFGTWMLTSFPFLQRIQI